MMIILETANKRCSTWTKKLKTLAGCSKIFQNWRQIFFLLNTKWLTSNKYLRSRKISVKRSIFFTSSHFFETISNFFELLYMLRGHGECDITFDWPSQQQWKSSQESHLYCSETHGMLFLGLHNPSSNSLQRNRFRCGINLRKLHFSGRKHF